MNIESVREFCLLLPYTTEAVKWGNDLTLCIGEKMFAVLNLAEGQQSAISFKCTPEKFAELIEKEGIIPAHYVARYHWVTLERFDALEEKELKDLIRNSYEMVYAKLPQKVKNQLNSK
jgi:predicted DNA-binding protein (MmcQ/YjbR family)